LVLTGTPARGEEVTEEKGIKTNIIYKNMDGEKIDPANLSQGSNFIAEVTVTNIGLAGDLTDMSLSQIFPSGWEIINFRLNDINQPFKNSTFTYQDIRDDRVYTYFDLKRAQKKTFYVQLNASYLGEFYLPAIKCEAMYDNTVYSIQEGMDVKVVKRQ
ncbi:MAG: hypothetical protein OEW75_13280, partial [Cyclobacteriaceae bacterium]|nr:hypothetical protein [Cyclobacteriaceae bacterium]